MHRIPRRPTLLFVSVLCIGQLVWTVVHEHVTGIPLLLTLLAVLLTNGAFHLLYLRGARQ